ncbi:MAG: Rpn family recombination-promoting nuclease/putative transposase [Bacteroidales bacterium]|nr:Rpn family recombination-promoting nuclease/putative transposase [Bacteroidales bacterium]
MKTEETNLYTYEPVFFNPVSDWGFHQIFGNPANSRLLRFLLNTIIDDKNISTVTLRDPNHQYINVEGGKSVFDVYCACDDGTNIIVEVQMANEGNFQDRAFAYSAMAVMDQAKKHWKYHLDKLYFIGITNFCMFDDQKKYITRAKLCDLDIPGKSIYDNYLQIFIELPKFVADDSSLNDERDKLLYILKYLRKMKAVPEWVEKSSEEIRMICESAKFDQLSESEKMECIMREDEQIRWEKAVEHSLKQGRAEGREEGEIVKQREIAAKMKSMGMPVETICEATGLSPETVAGL